MPKPKNSGSHPEIFRGKILQSFDIEHIFFSKFRDVKVSSIYRNMTAMQMER